MKAEPVHRGKSRNPEVTRRRLIEAAQREFNQVGYFGTDTNKIARAANYAPASFYRYFDDKLAIFLAVYQSWNDAQIIAIQDAISVGDRAPEAIASRMANVIVGFYLDWSGFRCSVRVLDSTEPRFEAFRLERRHEVLGLIRRLCRVNRWPERSAAEALSFFLTLERLCDGVSCGEYAAFGVSTAEAMKEVETLILRFITKAIL